jgi:hypothetical protein
MLKIVLIVIFVGLVIWLAPLASIWSINTLFGTTIPFTFDTWAASLILGGVVSGQSFLSLKAK